jgi:hypothetical protein
MAKLRDREKWKEWELFRESLRRATPVPKESEAEKRARILRLEADYFEWFRYYFPNYCSHPFGRFQKRSVNEILIRDTIYAVNAWAREHGKTAISMMTKLYCLMTGRINNILFISWSLDNAVELLTPMLINLESNERLINDYSLQKGFGTWDYSRGKWVLTNKCSIRAIGMGQSPRGTRNEEKRPDWLEFDDADSDEVCMNQARLNKGWNWIEQAAIPAMSIDHNKKILFNGNIIAKDSIIVRAMQKADFSQVVNLLDKNGQISWKERFTMEDINWMLSKISYASAQKEYFNNPITEGTVFKEIVWDKVPALSAFRFLVAYGDPAPSNKEAKGRGGACYKTIVLVGRNGDKFYIVTCFLQHVVNVDFVKWYYDISQYVNQKTQVYNYIENNSLQDPFYKQVFIPLFTQLSREKNFTVNITPDDRKKPDKFARIEGNLEPLNRLGRLIFNETEIKNPHMQRLKEQFEAVEPTLSALVDGPDAVEGAVWIINAKLRNQQPPVSVPRKQNKNRY